MHKPLPLFSPTVEPTVDAQSESITRKNTRYAASITTMKGGPPSLTEWSVTIT